MLVPVALLLFVQASCAHSSSVNSHSTTWLSIQISAAFTSWLLQCNFSSHARAKQASTMQHNMWHSVETKSALALERECAPAGNMGAVYSTQPSVELTLVM